LSLYNVTFVSMLISKSKGTNGRFAASVRSPTSPTGHSSDVPNGTGSDGRGSSEAAIDPLSQVCTMQAPRRAYCAGHTVRLTARSVLANPQENEYVSC
jgi:hypothetical protein